MRILTALTTACLLSTTPALADTAPINATYALYTGGVRMIDVDAGLDLNPNNYALSTKAATIGIFARLLPWKGSFETKGKANFQPTNHDYTVNWRRDSETLRFAYTSPGVLKSVTEIKGDQKTDKTPKDANIHKDTRDLLSAIARLMAHFEKTGDCTLNTTTFDGKRSMIVESKNVGKTTLNNPRLSSYTGEATGCSIKIVPDKGDWPKKPRGWIRIQQMGESQGRLPVIWFAKPDGAPHPIPVRIDIHTAYGDVIAHLRDLK